MAYPALFFQSIPQLTLIRSIAQQKKVKIYLVGGFLRDYLLSRPCFDFDFAVSKNAVSVAHLFARKIKGAFVLLDEEHGCARVVKRQEGQYLTFDFADFRDKTIEKDLARRDFTINAFAVDVRALFVSKNIFEILKSTKSAQTDLRRKVIRMVSVKSFKEDPLRLVRAFSSRALLEFQIEKKTLARIKKDKDLLVNVSYERIRDEFFKVLNTPRAAENIQLMDKARLLEKIIPYVRIMYKVDQGKYHHLDVWAHSLQAVVELEKVFEEFGRDKDIGPYLEEKLAGERTRASLIKLAILLHDIGKPETRKIENGKMSFHAHERVGKGIVRRIALLLKLSKKERFILEDMVLWHLRPGYLSNFSSPSERAVFRYFRDTKDEAVGILLLSLADQRATRGPLTTERDQEHHEEIVRRLIKTYYDKKKQKPFVRLINGDDLIRKLKLKPSPVFAKILRDVEEKQATGRIATKDEALRLARELAAKAS